jgi:hypothetical protein
VTHTGLFVDLEVNYIATENSNEYEIGIQTITDSILQSNAAASLVYQSRIDFQNIYLDIP